MSVSTVAEEQYHPVMDRVLYVGNVPLDTTGKDLSDMFDICLGKNSLAFLQYPFDEEAKCHKGFAFVMLNRGKDVGTCLSKKNRDWFYVEGPKSQGGFNSQGRCYTRIRSAHVEMPSKKEEPTHLIFSPKEEGVGLRDFKLAVEDVVRSMGVTIVKSEGELSTRKYVHIYTVDAESAAVVKMFCHQFREKDMTMIVRYARMPKAPKVVAEKTTNVTLKSVAPAPKLVLEPITENYGKFGIPYSAAVKGTSSAPSVPAKVIETSAASSGVMSIQKGRSAPPKKAQRLAGTA